MGYLAQIIAVDLHCPFGHIEKAGQQPDNRTFAGPGLANQGDPLARQGGKINASQHRLAIFISKTDLLKFNLALFQGRQADSLRYIFEIGFDIQQ